jgi:hypothetical protein
MHQKCDAIELLQGFCKVEVQQYWDKKNNPF